VSSRRRAPVVSNHLGKRPGQGPFPQRAHARPHHVTDDGMGQPQLDPPAVRQAGDQALSLEGLDGAGIGQPGELGLAERLAHGDQLQHGPLCIGQVPEPQRDQLDEAGGEPQLTPQPPDAAVGGQRAAVQRPSDQLTQDHRIAPAVIGQLTQ
jgi:hypothetical protein